MSDMGRNGSGPPRTTQEDSPAPDRDCPPADADADTGDRGDQTDGADDANAGGGAKGSQANQAGNADGDTGG